MTEEEILRILPELIQLRQDLHRHPELSGKEEATAQRLRAYLQKYMPDQLLTRLGSGTGMAAIFKGAKDGPTLMFRADMDALPIAENEKSSYSSQTKGVSHKCGHDGHMAMVAGLAPLLHRHPLRQGKVVLLMQPAEETGQGAKDLLEDKQFLNIKPDFIFGLHNLPSYPLGQVVLKEGAFCAASQGVRVRLTGKASHAAEPDKGLSPATGLAKLLQRLPLLPRELPHKDLLLLTLTHAQLGEATFGTSPGEAVLQATLRANQQTEMDLLVAAVEEELKAVAHQEGLELHYTYHEIFAGTYNGKTASALLQQAAEKTGMSVHIKEEPFRWSEDFGYYNQLAPAGFFGLGAGTDQPNLHNPAYDFPDALIPFGLRMYWSLIDGIRE